MSQSRQVAGEGAVSDDLAAGFRDLTSLFALPALWSGRDPESVVATLCEALEAILPAEVLFLQEGGERATGTLRVRGAALAGRPAEWKAFLRSLEGHGGGVELVASPLGALRVARAQMAFGEPRVTLWLGSKDPSFPRPTELAYLSVAASLASTGLRTARLLGEREFASRMKDEFLAMLGHELRNPIAAISAALQLLTLKNVAEVDHERQVIGRQVGQLARLVDDLLDVARVVRGKIELRTEPVDLGAAVAGALESVKPQFTEKRHVVSVDVPTLAVCADPARLEQILANLLSNAAKYTDAGGHIEVSARRDGDRVRVQVRDNGCGIEPELLPHVFEPFTQGRRAPDRAAGGLGIGLALVKSLVELHGGDVAARSPGSGMGSVFTVRLPPAPARAGAAASVTPRGAAPRTLRILIVDDNADAANTLASLLRLHGHDAQVALDAPGALEVLTHFAADAVVMDIGLPGLDGRALARRLRERMGARTPRIVALSGYGRPEDRALSLAAGMEHHFVKPVDATTLLAALGTGVVTPPEMT